jgi:hypothetical protein
MNSFLKRETLAVSDAIIRTNPANLMEKSAAANPMSGVFQNIDPPPPQSPPGERVPPAFGAGRGHTRWVERGWGVNILEDARHSSVLYI